MADVSDVEQAVANFATSILYPGGSSQASIVGAQCRVYRGWPNSATLNADLSGGTVNVTIVTDNDSGRTTSRYLPKWLTTSAVAGAAVEAVDGTIDIFGSPTVGDVVGALIDRTAYAYRVRLGDDAELVASNIGQLIELDRPATVRGSTVTVPGARSVAVRVVCDNTTSFENRRQEKDLRIICWCPNPAIRDAACSALDSGIAQLSFLVLPDDTQARVTYRNSASYDQGQNALLYRRDLVYTVEYPTITSILLPSMLFGVSDINGDITYG